ncbi:perilipin 6 [Chanos chanos]|uniref:Perilipin 6 n=1 Tax=Chanos chanos TaxID=29144 RepID=A0A6J2W0X5_CHACN|nr:perilipin-2-like [Chanos chanos]
MSHTSQNNEGNVLWRAVRLPLVSSALQRVKSVYVDAKGRYPLVAFMGGVAELSVYSVSEAASQRAAPLIHRFEPEIEVANMYALIGLEQLEKTFPILHQSTDEVIGHLKDSFFLTLDDIQTRVNEELDGVADRWDKLVEITWSMIEAIQNSQFGHAVNSGLDEVLRRSEEAVAKHLPLPPTLRVEWERMVQSLEDDDDDDEDEPGMWIRVRSLLLCLYLQLYHRAMKLKQRLDTALQTLSHAADTVGLTRLMQWVMSLLQLLFGFYVSQMQRATEARTRILSELRTQAQVLLDLPPVQQALAVPTQLQGLMTDLLELGQILVQLLINTTPLYHMLQQPSEQEVLDYVTQEDVSGTSSRRGSANSLFLRAMDGRPRRRKSLYARSRRGSAGGSISPAPVPVPANGRRDSLKQDGQPEMDTLAVPSTSTIRRRSSATEVLLAPIMQFVSQSQKAFEFLSSTPHAEDPVIPVVETTEH